MQEIMPQTGITDKIRAFTLKKNEITMAAIHEVHKMQRQLLFVSMKDYNDLLDENNKLKEEIKKLKVKLSTSNFVTKQEAADLLQIDLCDVTELLVNVTRKKIRNRYCYDKQELLAKASHI